MSVISAISRDPAGLTPRPGSRSSAATDSSRPIFLLERCLAIRFERNIQPQAPPPQPPTIPQKSNSSRPGSSLSQLSSWLAPWTSSNNGGRHSSADRTNIRTTTTNSDPISKTTQSGGPHHPLAVVQQDSSAPAGWVYDGGFVLYQNFQEANGYCYWNGPLLEAVTSLKFVGHVTPATILVTGDESSLETVRSAWARKVLRAPSGYIIVLVGDVDGCAVQPISQGQFTPLPEALCWVIWELNLAERSTGLEDVTAALGSAFPDLVPPGHKVVYDTLGKLIRDRKIYYNGKGYGVVTPDTYRKTNVVENGETGKGLLLSNEEALALAHGTVQSYPAGNVVHKAIQTNLVDVICRGNGTEKVLYGRTAEELAPATPSRLQRQRSLRMGSSGNGKRLSWSEYRSGGGSLKLSHAKAKKLMMEAAAEAGNLTDWEEAYDDETEHPVKTHKGKVSLLSRLFRRRSPSKKRTTLNSFNAQFPPPEWLEPGKVIHLHSVAVQTQSADMAAAAAASAETRNGGGVMSSNRSECSTSLSFSSPTPTRRSMQRRVTLSQPPSRSDSCSPLRGVPPAHPMTAGKLDDGMTGGRITRCSPATSISSGLGRSFSPASANSYQRPMGILRNHSPPSPTQSTDSLYSSSVGPSASAICRSPVPSLASHRPFQRFAPDRASYNGGTPGRYRSPSLSTANHHSMLNSTDYQPFQRLASSRSASFRQPRSSTMSPTLLGSSTPRPYVPMGRLGLDEQKSLIAQQRAALRDHFFQQTQLTAPPLISSVMKPRTSPMDELSRSFRHHSPARSTVSSVSCTNNNKKYYETDLDLTIKVPKKSSSCVIEDVGNHHRKATKPMGSVVSETTTKGTMNGAGSGPASRVINISVTKSESLNYVSQLNDHHHPGNNVTLLNKENAAVDDSTGELNNRPNFSRKCSEDNGNNFRTFPSLTELNINFKSITGQKILQGLNSNSTDTLVEVNMRDGEVSKTEMAYI